MALVAGAVPDDPSELISASEDDEEANIQKGLQKGQVQKGTPVGPDSLVLLLLESTQ